MICYSLFYEVTSKDTIQQLKAPLKTDHSLVGHILRNLISDENRNSIALINAN